MILKDVNAIAVNMNGYQIKRSLSSAQDANLLIGTDQSYGLKQKTRRKMPEEEKQDLKKFGIGKIFLESIQDLLRKANFSSQCGNYSGWRNYLDCIIRKCSGRLTPEEEKDIINKTAEVDRLSIKHTVRCVKDQKKTDNSVSKQTIIVGRKYTMALAEYEKIIVQVLDGLGWLIPSDKKPKRPQ